MKRDTEPKPADRKPPTATLWLGAGVFFAVLAVYVLSNPGRIDLIDGQVRYEVTMNWLTMGRPVILDFRIPRSMGGTHRGRFTYSFYGAGASVAAMPLVFIGTFYDDPPGEVTRFLFSLTTSIFGAAAAALLCLFYVQLGIGVRKALMWTSVAAFATLMWPASESTFDNGQHACLVLIAVFLGFLSSRRKSLLFAALGGLAAGLLFTYQEYFALIIPLLALSTLDSRIWQVRGGRSGIRVLLHPIGLLLRLDFRDAIREFKSPCGLSADEVIAFHGACRRCGLFLLLSLVGVLLALDFNYVRFGSLVDSAKVHSRVHGGPPRFGNPIAGLLTLLVSPGKSILLYSPPIVLGLAGIRRLWRREPQIVLTIVAASVVLVLFISTIAFAGGDWCWGPRYLTPLVPLWALAMPFASSKGRSRRALAAAIVGAGLIVQCLGLSVENQRYFFERALPDLFWAGDPWFYLNHSALAARPREMLSLIKGPPPEATLFNTDNNPPTYATLGPFPSIPRSQAPVWMRHYKVFYVPRPWPLWMRGIPPDQRGINLGAWLAGTLGLGLLGFALLSGSCGVRGQARRDVQVLRDRVVP
jgi:hypothetical protein